MQLPRRRFLHLAASAAALPTFPRIAAALDYPIRPVHVVVGFPAGTATDIVARIVGQALAQRLGQQIVIENRPGASTNIATEVVARARRRLHTAPDWRAGRYQCQPLPEFEFQFRPRHRAGRQHLSHRLRDGGESGIPPEVVT